MSDRTTENSAETQQNHGDTAEDGLRLVEGGKGLVVSRIGKSYNKRPVVRSVSLSLKRGEAVGLLGPNGAGKTTCFYMITGLIPADTGSIQVDGHDVTKLPMYRRARLGIGYLPQEASIFRGLTAEQNIRATAELLEPDGARLEGMVEALLAEFGITHIRNTPSVALSGGERRRVEIARCLATHPSYILLDEPFAGIDPIAVGEIRDLVKHLKDRGIGVLITDHNVRDALDVIDRAYILHDGRVLKEGTPAEIVADRDVRRVYLGEKFSLDSAMAGVGPRLELRQGQSLVMTPQLQQAIKLLQLSNIELAEYCESELEKNPLLERDDREAAPVTETPEGANNERAANEGADVALSRDDFSKTSDMDEAAHDNMYDAEAPRKQAEGPQSGSLTDWTTVKSGNVYDGEDGLEASVAADATLKDHLEDQLSIAALLPEDRMILLALIDAIDETGYLRVELIDVADRLGCEIEDVQAVLGVLQGFDPVGVGARDLAECLSLQLKARDRLDPAMQAMMTRLDLVARRDMPQLTALCGVDAEDISDMIGEIRQLNPKPGLAFGSEPVTPVVPDVFVKEGPDGGWLVELNSDTLPRLLVNNQYYGTVSKNARDKDSKNYLSDCLNTANWLVKSLDQRARTILKVASEIVRHQDAFLTHGVRHLRPLNLRIIADAISMHESTVSRVTSNKYIATPRGLFELKYFFTASIQSIGGSESHSAEAVRDRIREMIENEEPREILSDDRIVSLLTADGVNIARRTVAKYREALRIPSSVERRRLKAGG